MSTKPPESDRVTLSRRNVLAGGVAAAAASPPLLASILQSQQPENAVPTRRVPAEVDLRTGYFRTPKPKVQQRPRIIAWFPIGNSSADNNNRCISWNIKKEGWRGFVDRWAWPALSSGFDAIQLHNPGGTKTTEDMMADQFIAAKEAGLGWILEGFVEAWKPVTRRAPVIAYLGMLPHNKRLEGLLNRKDYFGFLVNIAACYRLPLEAGMDIAFDAMHHVREGSWELAVYRMLTAMGVRTYVEPTPHSSDRPLYEANFQIVNTTLERTLKNAEPWMAPLEQLSGERVILLNNLPEGRKWDNQIEWVPQWIAHWLYQGWSVAVSPAPAIESNQNIRDLVRPHLDRLTTME